MAPCLSICCTDFFVLFLFFVHVCVCIEYISVWSERERSLHKSVRVINGLGNTNSLFHFHWERWRGDCVKGQRR